MDYVDMYMMNPINRLFDELEVKNKVPITYFCTRWCKKIKTIFVRFVHNFICFNLKDFNSNYSIHRICKKNNDSQLWHLHKWNFLLMFTFTFSVVLIHIDSSIIPIISNRKQVAPSLFFFLVYFLIKTIFSYLSNRI